MGFVKYSWVFTPFFKNSLLSFSPFFHALFPLLQLTINFYCHFLVHVSRIAAAQPKKHLLAPHLLSEKENDAKGLGFLDYLGIFTLVGGSIAAIVLACCCWIKNTGTHGPV